MHCGGDENVLKASRSRGFRLQAEVRVRRIDLPAKAGSHQVGLEAACASAGSKERDARLDRVLTRRYTEWMRVHRIAVRTLCKFSLRTASGPEGSSAK
jgi:hypothetical protein